MNRLYLRVVIVTAALASDLSVRCRCRAAAGSPVHPAAPLTGGGGGGERRARGTEGETGGQGGETSSRAPPG